MDFVIVDETDGATTGDGAELTPELLQAIAGACRVQLNVHFAGEYGGAFGVRVGTPADILPGESVFAILPALPTVPGAIAYHDSNGAGVPVLFDAITLSDTLTGPGNSLSVAVSHEFVETALDEGCNIWCDDGAGREFAREGCDAVEAQSYSITVLGGHSVSLSNFVLRAFFVPRRAGPYDYMSKAGTNPDAPRGPMATATGGYQIVRSSGQSEHSVNARELLGPYVVGAPSRRALARKGSRRERRGVEVAR